MFITNVLATREYKKVGIWKYVYATQLCSDRPLNEIIYSNLFFWYFEYVIIKSFKILNFWI